MLRAITATDDPRAQVASAIERVERLLMGVFAGPRRDATVLEEAVRRARSLVTDDPLGPACGFAGPASAVEQLVADVLPSLCLTVDDPAELIHVVDSASALAGEPSAEFRVRVARGALGSFSVLSLRPDIGVHAILTMVGALAAVREASLWQPGDAEGPGPQATAGDRPSPSAAELVRKALGEGKGLDASSAAGPPDDLEAIVVPGPGGTCRGALVVGIGADAVPGWRSIADAAAYALGALLDREALLNASSERESSLSAACERRLVRLAFDLHDGPLQNVSAIAGDLKLLRHHIERHAAQLPEAQRLLGTLGDLEARLCALDDELRALSTSLEAPAISQRPMVDVIRAEAEAFRQRCEIDLELDLSGELKELTASQRIAVARIVQEALTNVRDHSSARRVRVSLVGGRDVLELNVADDGCGFDVSGTLLDAGRRGRLGLVGMSERVRMLGGTCDIRSRPGGPTELEVVLPRWRPNPVGARAGRAVARLVAT